MGCLRAFGVLLASSATMAIAGAGCAGNVEDKKCTLVGCASGFTIHWKGTFEPDTEYELDAFSVTSLGDAPLLHCVRSVAGDAGLFDELNILCSSTLGHRELYDTITLDFFENGPVRVVVSSRGAKLGEVLQDLTFTTWQPNGPDCAPTCTAAGVRLQIPDPDAGVSSDAQRPAVSDR